MTAYEQQATVEVIRWKRRMEEPPSIFSSLAGAAQARIARSIPEKFHQVMTAAIEGATRVVMAGADFVTGPPIPVTSLEETERNVLEKIKFYRNTAAAEGGITGAGGILFGLADFPLWLTLKMKMLFEIARLYGRDTSDFRERYYILTIFQLTFSTQQKRNELFPTVEGWDRHSDTINSLDDLDWRTFQQQYRDSIDLAKLLQLVPGIGAAVGVVVNHRLTEKLGKFAMNCYRMRMGLTD